MQRILLAAAAAAIAASALALWLRAPAPVEAPRPATPAAEPVPDAVPDQVGARSGPERSVAAADPALATIAPSQEGEPCTVEVVLLAVEEAVGVAGRTVALHVAELGGAWSDSRVVEGTTDDGGVCRWTLAGPLELRRVRIAADTTSPGVTRHLDRLPVVPGDVRRVELEVESGSSLAARVVDETGAPVPRAEVAVWSGGEFRPDTEPERVVVADAAGRFELAHLGRPFALVARAEGRTATRGLRGELPRNGRAEGDLELVLAPAWHVFGQVLGARGEPVAVDLSVRAHNSRSSQDGTSVAGVSTFRPGHADAHTDEEGRFELGPLPREGVNVRLQSMVYGERYLRLPLEPGPWVIRLEDGVVLRGSAVDAAGEPIAGARVGLDGDGLSSRRTRTTEDGRFEFRGLEELDSVHLHVAADGFAPWLREGIELSLEVPPQPIDARLEPGLPLGGRVVDAVGAPVVGVRVVIEGERGYDRHYSTDAPATLEHLADRGERRTGREGSFRFDDLYAGEFAVRAYPPGDRVLFAEVRAHPGETDLVLRMDPAEFERVVLSGRVVDALELTPVTSFTATAMIEHAEGAGGFNRRVMDEDGRFRIALPQPARMYLQVAAPGYATWTEPMGERGPGEHGYEVRLVRERGLNLRLMHPDGTAADSSLEFYDEQGQRLMVRTGGSHASSSLFTQDGVARGVALPAAPLRMVVRGNRDVVEQEFDLDLRVDPGPVLEFTVARPIAGASAGRSVDCGMLVLSAPRAAQVDVPALEKLLEGEGPWTLPPGVQILTVELRVDVLAQDGRKLARCVVRPGPDGARVEFRDLHSGHTMETDLPPVVGAAFLGPFPSSTSVVRLEAPGHDPLEFAFDPGQENGGMPRLTLLRR